MLAYLINNSTFTHISLETLIYLLGHRLMKVTPKLAVAVEQTSKMLGKQHSQKHQTGWTNMFIFLSHYRYD